MNIDRQESKGDISDNTSLFGRTMHRPVWVLWLSIFTRALHQVGAALFLCLYLFADRFTLPDFSIYMAGITGVVLFFAEAMRHREVYREISGMVTLAKCVLLGAGFHGLLPAAPAILAVFIIASIGSHAPKNIRHRRIY
ncbi:hypothetical protein [Desulfosediminicola flagellatus]|uniref:hypothetical protein n=1 Tax=Desulfosediminicola flagellatus TaxID=2569541 RepID=UPI001E3CC3BD|nr:hypothetical protein [Desulfosediminicola flagellatus]